MADNWKKKYDDLLVNFKDLDKYNDVLYLTFHLARRLRNSGFSHDTLAELYAAVAEVERFEDDLYANRKAQHRPSKEDADRGHLA